jgi:hypothetical protein
VLSHAKDREALDAMLATQIQHSVVCIAPILRTQKIITFARLVL